MKTAMQEFIGKLRELAFSDSHHLGLGDIRITQGMIDEYEEEFVEKERRQIIDAHGNQLDYSNGSQIDPNVKTGEQYYNERYGSKN